MRASDNIFFLMRFLKVLLARMNDVYSTFVSQRAEEGRSAEVALETAPPVQKTLGQAYVHKNSYGNRLRIWNGAAWVSPQDSTTRSGPYTVRTAAAGGEWRVIAENMGKVDPSGKWVLTLTRKLYDTGGFLELTLHGAHAHTAKLNVTAGRVGDVGYFPFTAVGVTWTSLKGYIVAGKTTAGADGKEWLLTVQSLNGWSGLSEVTLSTGSVPATGITTEIAVREELIPQHNGPSDAGKWLVTDAIGYPAWKPGPPVKLNQYLKTDANGEYVWGEFPFDVTSGDSLRTPYFTGDISTINVPIKTGKVMIIEAYCQPVNTSDWPQFQLFNGSTNITSGQIQGFAYDCCPPSVNNSFGGGTQATRTGTAFCRADGIYDGRIYFSHKSWDDDTNRPCYVKLRVIKKGSRVVVQWSWDGAWETSAQKGYGEGYAVVDSGVQVDTLKLYETSQLNGTVYYE